MKRARIRRVPLSSKLKKGISPQLITFHLSQQNGSDQRHFKLNIRWQIKLIRLQI